MRKSVRLTILTLLVFGVGIAVGLWAGWRTEPVVTTLRDLVTGPEMAPLAELDTRPEHWAYPGASPIEWFGGAQATLGQRTATLAMRYAMVSSDEFGKVKAYYENLITRAAATGDTTVSPGTPVTQPAGSTAVPGTSTSVFKNNRLASWRSERTRPGQDPAQGRAVFSFRAANYMVNVFVDRGGNEKETYILVLMDDLGKDQASATPASRPSP